MTNPDDSPDQLNPPSPNRNPAADPGRALNSRQIAHATGLLMFAFALSGIFGIVRNAVVGATFGAGFELDAFNAAIRVPETLFTLVAGGALGSAFIPVFSSYLSKDEYNKAWQLASAVLSLVAIVAATSAVVAFVLAEPIVHYLLLPSASDASRQLTVELMRIMLLTVVLFGISGLLMGILNSHQQFLVPSIAPTMYNIGIIFGALVFTGSMGIHGLAWGAVLGALFHLGVQVPSILKLPYRQIRFAPNLHIEGVQGVLKLMGPRLIGLMVVQANFWVNVALASGMGVGSLSSLTYAFTLMFTILGVLGQSLGTAVFPTLSAFHAEGDTEGFQRTLSSALRNVLFLSIPAGLGMVVLSRPIVQLMFQRGEWTTADTTATAWALIFYGIGLMGHAALEILARTFYALHDTWTPVIVGGSAMILNVVLSILFVILFRALGADTFPRGPFGGLALANSMATAIESTILWLILRRRVEGLNPAPILLTLSRTLLAGCGMVVIVTGWLQLDLPLLVELFGGMALGMGSFAGLALLLRIPEATVVPNQIVSRIKR